MAEPLHRALPDFDLGTAGASARAQYEERRRRDDARAREVFGSLAPLAKFVAGPKAATETWSRGATGEERIGAFLTRALDVEGIVLHDRAVKWSMANIDHIAIVASGVWVVDSKHYRHRPEERRVGGIFVGHRSLSVGGRDQTRLIAHAVAQRARVHRALGSKAPVQVALCFTGAAISPFARPFRVQGVLVTWPKALARVLRRPGPFDAATRESIAAQLARAFPPYGAGSPTPWSETDRS